MTVTESFLFRIKKYVPRVSAADWKSFATVAQNHHVGSLHRLANSLANCLHGKKSSKATYDELSRLSIGFIVAQQVSVSLAATFQKKLTLVLEHDLSLPKIQRIFPDFVGDTKEYLAKLDRTPHMVGLFSALLCVTHWQIHEDLVVDVIGIAQSVEALRLLKKAQFVYKKVLSNKGFQASDLEGLALLRTLAERHHLIATLRALPSLPMHTSKSKPPPDPEILESIVRFPVRDDLESMERDHRRQLESSLSDLDDFFQDYPIGEVRRKGLQDFPKRCRVYCVA